MDILKAIRQASPTILTVLGAGGVIGTGYFAARGGAKANERLKNARREKQGKLSFGQTIYIALPCYMPAIGVGAASILCVAGANIAGKRQRAALTGACVMLDSMYREYREKTIEERGEEEDRRIRSEIMCDQIEKQDISQAPEGKKTFYIEYGRRFFERTMEEVMYAEYHFNRNFVLRGYADLNEFFRFLELEETPEGEILGWSMEAGEICYGYQWVDFVHRPYQLDDGLECIAIEMPFAPTADFDGEPDEYGEALLEQYRERDAKNATACMKGG